MPSASENLQTAAMRFVLEPENQDAYHDSFYSNSVAWPPEFLLLGDAVLTHCAHEYQHKDCDPTEDPEGYCTIEGCEQPQFHWIHLNTSDRAEMLAASRSAISSKSLALDIAQGQNTGR